MIELTPAKDIPQEFWPLILFEEHRDWTFFRKVKRSDTALFGRPPKKIAGNAPELEFWYRDVYQGIVWKKAERGEIGAQQFFHPKPIPDPDGMKKIWWRGDPDFYSARIGPFYWRALNRWDTEDSLYEKPSLTVKHYG